jgi:hypothetical protein
MRGLFIETSAINWYQTVFRAWKLPLYYFRIPAYLALKQLETGNSANIETAQ